MAYQQNQQPGFQYGDQGYQNYPGGQGYPNQGYPPNNSGYPPNPGYPGGQGHQQPYSPNSGYPPPVDYPGNQNMSHPGSYPPGPQPHQPYPMPQPYAGNNPGPQQHQPYAGNNPGAYPPVDQNPRVAGHTEQVLDPEKLQQVGKKDKKKHSDEEKKKEFGFDDKSVRRGFVRKVYSILFFQLLITCGIISLMLYHEPTQKYVENHQELFWISLATLIVAIVLMSCCGNLRRKFPLNYIFLIIFTAAESILMGLAASTFNTDVVLMAAGITLGICVLLTLFAFQTKIDFTFLSGALFVGIFILIICGIVAACIQSKAMLMVYAGLGVFLFSLYLIYDTQLIIGGKHSDNISPEEYIFASLSLYLDVMRIFSYILILFGVCKS